MASDIGLDGVELVPYIIIRMKPIWGFKYQELPTYSKLNHKIMEQFKLV